MTLYLQNLEVSSSCTKLRPFLSNAKQFPSSRGSPTAGPRRQCFTVSITDNDIAENTELISLFLQEDTSFSHTGATIDPDQTKVTILDDDGIFIMGTQFFTVFMLQLQISINLPTD